MRRRVTVVGSVCLSVKSHLTSGASVRLENLVTYSAGNEGQKFSLRRAYMLYKLALEVSGADTPIKP